MSWKPFLTIAFLLAAAGNVSAAMKGTLSVSAFVLDKGHCSITTPNPLNFGNLNAMTPTLVTKPVNVIVNCKGTGPGNMTFIIDYVNPPDTYVMNHSTPFPSPDFIRYSLNLPVNGTSPKNNTNTTVTLIGTIQAADYLNAPMGGYTGTAAIQVLP